MKTYKLNNIEVNIDEIQKLIKDNPEILEKKEGRYFFPKIGEKYYSISGCGYVTSSENLLSPNGDDEFKIQIISMGVYRTKEQAELARDKQKAIVACWKWAQENAPFEPDWSDERQHKWSVLYSSVDNVFTHWACTLVKIQLTLPYFKTKEVLESFIEANREHLELLFKE